MTLGEAKQLHRDHGHDAFMFFGYEAGNSDTFLYNVCAMLGCEKRELLLPENNTSGSEKKKED